jgi:hypothetical protein
MDEYGEPAAQTHALYCLWIMDKGRVRNPPAWYTALLIHNWNALHGMPDDWLPTVLHFRVDENTLPQEQKSFWDYFALLLSIRTSNLLEQAIY